MGMSKTTCFHMEIVMGMSKAICFHMGNRHGDAKHLKFSEGNRHGDGEALFFHREVTTAEFLPLLRVPRPVLMPPHAVHGGAGLPRFAEEPGEFLTLLAMGITGTRSKC